MKHFPLTLAAHKIHLHCKSLNKMFKKAWRVKRMNGSLHIDSNNLKVLGATTVRRY